MYFSISLKSSPSHQQPTADGRYAHAGSQETTSTAMPICSIFLDAIEQLFAPVIRSFSVQQLPTYPWF
eukprot:scaffold274_cov144-Skeletonema_menzelii.AAC.8